MDNNLAEVKVRILKILLPLAAVIAIYTGCSAYGVERRLSEAVILLALGAILALLSVLLWTHRERFRQIELLSLGVILVGFIAVWVRFLYPPGGSKAANVVEILPLIGWVPALFVACFLVFDGTRAAIIALLFLVANALVAAPFLLASPGVTRGALVQLVLGMGANLFLLGLFSTVKAAYIKERERTALLERLATHDFLTGLRNRRGFEETLQQQLTLAKRYQEEFSLILFDLDDFKDVNDRFGHETGDEVLKLVSVEVAQEVRASDILARWGGEEFTILTPHGGADEAFQLAERVRKTLAGREFSQVGAVTASFGVTTYTPGDTVASLMKRADMALYQAKREGKNRVILRLNDSGESTDRARGWLFKMLCEY